MKTKPNENQVEMLAWEEESFVHRRVTGCSCQLPAALCARPVTRRRLLTAMVLALSILIPQEAAQSDLDTAPSASESAHEPGPSGAASRPGKSVSASGASRRSRKARSGLQVGSQKTKRGHTARRRHKVQVTYSTD